VHIDTNGIVRLKIAIMDAVQNKTFKPVITFLKKALLNTRALAKHANLHVPWDHVKELRSPWERPLGLESRSRNGS
jgi:hypothetical protein